MRGRTTFAEVLDEALRENGHEEPAWHASQPVWPAPAPPFLFVNPQSPFRGKTAGRTVGMPASLREARPHGRPADSRPPDPPRPARSLTSTQQRAFDALVGLGANLNVDFTRAELRRAFRLLARKYHPDRHPASTPEDSARLSKLFASLSDHYQCLLAVVEPGTGYTR